MIIYKLYYSFWINRKKINKNIITIIVCFILYRVLQSLLNEIELNVEEIATILFYYIIWIVVNKLFYSLIGMYWILQYQRYQTRLVQRDVLDKNMKAVGKRGSGKDTIQSGMITNFVYYTKEQIEEELHKLSIHLYMFDLKRIKEYIKNDILIFNVASKEAKKEIFFTTIASNALFLKERFKDREDSIMTCFNKNIDHLRTVKSKYIITDGINFKHIIEFLYDYLYLTWRLEIDIWVFANQPYIQSYDEKKKVIKMAKIFSPDLKSTKTRTVKTKEGNKLVEYVAVESMIAEDWVIFWESESDIWWNNIDSDVKKNIQERGMRWYEVAQRHILGEHAMTLRNGQVAGRTVKIQRDLEESFYSVTRTVKIYGGNIRIFFIKFFMLLIFPFYRGALKSKVYQKIDILKHRGWLKLETVFSRTENINYQAPGITLSQLLDKNEPLYMSMYQTTLVFKIKDCWGKYNTHYLEYIAETITKESTTDLVNAPEWDENLKMKEDHIIYMNYDTVDVFRIDPQKKYSLNDKYQKKEKNSPAIKL